MSEEVNKIIRQIGLDNPIDYLMVTAYHLGYLDGVLGERTGRHRGMNVNEILQEGLERGKAYVKELRGKKEASEE